MTTTNAITIPLSNERLEQLTQRANAAGISPEEFVRASVEHWLTQPREDFAQAAEFVLRKNAELYRRLA